MSIPSLLTKLFRRKASIPQPTVEPAPAKVEIVRVEPQKMTLNEWRQRETLVVESMRLARNTIYQSQLDILKNEHPATWVFNPVGVSRDDRIARQGQIEGYEICLSNIHKFCFPLKKRENVEATFEPPEEQRNQRLNPK